MARIILFMSWLSNNLQVPGSNLASVLVVSSTPNQTSSLLSPTNSLTAFRVQLLTLTSTYLPGFLSTMWTLIISRSNPVCGRTLTANCKFCQPVSNDGLWWMISNLQGKVPKSLSLLWTDARVAQDLGISTSPLLPFRSLPPSPLAVSTESTGRSTRGFTSFASYLLASIG